MVSVISILPFADLGIGAAVVNAASTANTAESRSHAEAVVAGALRALTAVAAVLTVVALAISALGGWQAILGQTLQDDSTRAVGFCIVLFAIALPINVCQRVAVGVGANDKQIVLQVVQPFLTLALVVITAVTFHDPSLAFVSFFFAYLLTSTINLFFANRWSDGLISSAGVRARRLRERLNVTREIVDAALPMSVMMVGIPLVLQSHRIMLSNFGTTVDVARYSLAAQIFLPITALAAAASTTLWPFFARARVDGPDGGSSRSSSPFFFSAVLAGAALVLCGGLTLLSPWVSALISGGAVDVSVALGIASTAFVGVQIAQAPLGVFLTDVVGLRFQAVCMVPLVIVVWAASRYAVEGGGSEGVLWMTTAAMVVLQVIPFAFFITLRSRTYRGRHRRLLVASDGTPMSADKMGEPL
jgi:O-antigen/teichoic acid export membrane protein